MEIEERAQEHEAKEWEARNAPRPAAKVYAKGEPGYGPAACVECEAKMPDLRRTMGSKCCTACGTAQERRRAHFFKK